MSYHGALNGGFILATADGNVARRVGRTGMNGSERIGTDRIGSEADPFYILFLWLELRRLPPIMGFVGSGPGLVIILT